MGQQQSCENLDKDLSACEIHNCVDKVQGLASNSASPSDTWVLSFKDGTKYEDTPIEQGFLKFFIEPEGVNTLYYADPLNALKYEMEIYRDVIRPLVDRKICPNFIRYLANGEDCTYDSLFEILKGHTHASNNPSVKLSDEDLANNLAVNIWHVATMSGGRPSINNKCKIMNKQSEPLVKKLKFAFLVNEAVSSDTRTFRDWFRQVSSSQRELLPSEWSVIFQIMIACYAMSLTKTVHNDLHDSNIWVQPYDKPLKYVIGSEKGTYGYNVDVGEKVMIYDFDRAYSVRVGENPILKNPGIQKNSQTNEYIPNKDALKILTYVYDELVPSDQAKILDCIARKNDTEFVKNDRGITAKHVYEEGDEFLLVPKDIKKTGRLLASDYRPLETREYSELFLPIHEIVYNFGNLTETETGLENLGQDMDNLYFCTQNASV